MVTVLKDRHAGEILVFLLNRGEIKKTDLLEIISSSDSLSRVLRRLDEEGFIHIETRIMGRKVIHINLTPKGRAVDENIAHLEEFRITLPEGLVSEIEKIIKKDKTYTTLQEYTNEAIRKAIEKWKMEHAVG